MCSFSSQFPWWLYVTKRGDCHAAWEASHGEWWRWQGGGGGGGGGGDIGVEKEILSHRVRIYKNIFENQKRFFCLWEKEAKKTILCFLFLEKQTVCFSNVFPHVDKRGQKDFLPKNKTPP